MSESKTTGAPRSNRGAAEICSENFREARRRKFFSVVAKHAYPKKTVAEVRVLTGEPERTIYEWMSGRTMPPYSIMFLLFGEISGD